MSSLEFLPGKFPFGLVIVVSALVLAFINGFHTCILRFKVARHVCTETQLSARQHSIVDVPWLFAIHGKVQKPCFSLECPKPHYSLGFQWEP